jgi:hypothetical protein
MMLFVLFFLPWFSAFAVEPGSVMPQGLALLNPDWDEVRAKAEAACAETKTNAEVARVVTLRMYTDTTVVQELHHTAEEVLPALHTSVLEGMAQYGNLDDLLPLSEAINATQEDMRVQKAKLDAQLAFDATYLKALAQTDVNARLPPTERGTARGQCVVYTIGMVRDLSDTMKIAVGRGQQVDAIVNGLIARYPTLESRIKTDLSDSHP